MRTIGKLAVALATSVPTLALAQPDFGAVVTGPQAPGVWYTDRYAPAGFETVAGPIGGRTDVLRIGIDDADAQGSRPAGFNTAFYNTQGRKYDLGVAGPFTLTADLYVPLSWSDAGNGYRRTDMWATMMNAANAVTGYPIIGFTNYGGVARFRAYNGLAAPNDWIDFAALVNYDSWNTLAITFDGTAGSTSITYSVNGVAQAGTIDVSGSTQVGNVIMQAYNFGQTFGANTGPDYNAYWSNTATVPEPGTYVLMATGLLGVAGAARWRRRKA
jgi:hypothetical protein